MRITFSNNPIDHIQCWLSNKYEDYTQYVWNKKHHRVTCRICGDVLDSNKEKYSPEQCGWKKINGYTYKTWICHRCLEHRDFKPFIKEIDKQKEELWRKAREQEKDEIIF